MSEAGPPATALQLPPPSLDRHWRNGPRASTVTAAHDRGRGAIVHPGGKIDGVAVAWIGRDALDAQVAVLPLRILERHPALLLRFPAIDAAHVCAQVGEAF